MHQVSVGYGMGKRSTTYTPSLEIGVVGLRLHDQLVALGRW